jgi:hypothetical protein
MTPEDRATRANAMARELQLRSSRPANLAEWDAIAIAIVLTEINAAIAEEREACARVAESDVFAIHDDDNEGIDIRCPSAPQIAAAIRRRA